MDEPAPPADQQNSSAPVPVSLPLHEKLAQLKKKFEEHPQKKPITTIGVVVLVLVVGVVAKGLLGGIGFFVPNVNYVSVYTLVNDKISQHGAIIVNLPKGVSKNDAEKKVSFSPDIKGAWVSSSLSQAIVYKPQSELALGKHYLVSLVTADGTIEKDFAVDEDPAVVSVFPDSSAEAPLTSAITIVFNRPMVPLTTLSELESKNIPVSISPETPGKFKWISTRVLQFIPQKTLYGSSHYSVAIHSDFVSMDGLSVPAKTYSFTTTQLRLDHTTGDTVVYNEPIQFYFNQPIDLQKTSSTITVKNNATGRGIEFVTTYGTTSVWDDAAQKYRDVENRSILNVYPKNSLHGHANVWDFSTQYTATLSTAYPIGGDITWHTGSTVTVTTSPVVQDVTAQSDKTPLASPDLFDPAGTVTFTFYEDIDLGKSSIDAKGLKKIVYAKKCDGVLGDGYDASSDCAKADDKSTLILSFDSGAYTRGERVPVVITKLVNTDGYQVNATPLTATLTVYPELKIMSTVPATNAANASISELVLCTNVPLKIQDGKEFYTKVKANKYMVFGRWDNAYLQTQNSYETNPPCAVGAYVNRIQYGLLPRNSYSITAAVEDVFGQKTGLKLSLNTQQAPKFYLRFQNLQKIYNVTTPEHTRLTYATENFDLVNVLVCQVTPESMVRLLATQPGDTTIASNSSLPCIASVKKTIPLKSDQWVNQYFQIDIKDYFSDPRGQYVISFSHPQYQNGDGVPLYARTYLGVTNLAVVDNRVKWTSYDYLPDVPNLTAADTRGSVFWLSLIHSLQPQGDAQISVYQSTDRYQTTAPLVLAKSTLTNSNGFAEFPLIADVAGAAITSGDETAVVSPWADTLSQGSWSSGYQDERVYLYTDRPIYRPGQHVFLKGLYRVNFDGSFQVFQDNDVKVEVTDSKGNVILTQKVPVSAYGTFSTDLVLPADAPLGTYFISARNQQVYFDVQEYAAAAFETNVQADKEEYIAGDTVTVSVSGKYYFGVPLDGGTLDYSITSQNFYFDRYSDEYFNFGSYWYSCYDCGYGDTYLKTGKVNLDAQGATQVQLPLDFAALYKGGDADQSKILVFHGTMKDKQGKSVSFEKSFIVHRGDFYLGVKSDPSFTGVKQSFNLRVKTVDVQGKPIGKSDISVLINKVSWQSNKRQEVDGGYYNRPQRILTPVITRNIATNYAGEYSEKDLLVDPGEYEIDAVGKDKQGNLVKSMSEIYVYGEGTVDVQPTNNATLNLKAEKTDVHVGDVAKFIIQNPYPHAKALVSIERGHIFTYEVIDLTQSVYEYQFPITEEYTPNVYASVVLLSPDPGVKFGQLEFTVDRKQKELTINVTPDKKSYLPGQKVNLTVTTTDALGHRVPADVSVAVADVSVLALKGNPKKNPLVFFYDGFPLTVTAETNVKNLLEESEIPTGTKGGGGGDAADLAMRKRGEFKDTAYWQAEVITNAQGTATVSFTLPDNLTKWQVETVGITKDTKVGVSYQELIAQKEVMAVPLAPRFIVPGDTFMLGAKIFNQSSKTQTLSVAIESPTLTIDDIPRVQKIVKAGDTATVYFKVKAPLEKVDGVHTYTLSAKNNDYNDTVEQSLPITRNMTYESTATAGQTQATTTSEYLYLPDTVLKDRGGLTVQTSATLAVYLSDALTYLFQYPYGCSEQLASKLSAIAITKRALAVPNVGSSFTLPTVSFSGTDYTVDQAVTIGLNQIYDNLAVEGGFSYYKGLRSDPYLTLQVVNALVDLQHAGYTVKQSVIDQAVQYLYGQVSYFRTHTDTDTLVLLAYTLSRVDPSSGASSGLTREVENLATAAYLTDKASSNTLAYLALLEAKTGASAAMKDKVFGALINRVDIDSRGAYVKSNQHNFGWAYYETPEKDTALFLKALVADNREYAETPNLLRWLVTSRASDGSWGSTNTSVAAIDALADYLTWKRETESSFALTTMLDGDKVSATTFAQNNILSTVKTFTPVADIGLGKMHTLTFTKTNANTLPNTFYYDLSLKYYLPVEHIAPRDEGIAITREFYSLTDPKNTQPLTSAKVGDVVHGVLTIISPKEHHTFSVEDYIPAGFELVNFNLATEDQASLQGGVGYAPAPKQSRALTSGWSNNFLAALWSFGNASPVDDGRFDPSVTYQKLYPAFQEMHDDRLFLFVQDLQPGTYTYEYYVRATTPGTFSHLPAIASDMYFPESFGRTAGSVFTVSQ